MLEKKLPTGADLFFGSSPTTTQKQKGKTMPKAKKNVKLRDQKPARDPKGGRHGHHQGHHRAAAAAIAATPRERNNPFDQGKTLL
jgi:hypothetical protein